MQNIIASCFRRMRPKHIGVMTLTFRGHVTPSATWPFCILCRPFPIGGPLEPNNDL